MRRYNPDKKFIIKWTKSGTKKVYTNRFLVYDEAEKRFYWLLDNMCSPVWIQRGEVEHE